MKKPIFILATLFIIIMGLFLTRMVISNKISTSGVALGQMQDQIYEYKTKNSILREKILTQSSLTNIASRAEKIGFVESKSSFALLKTRPIASAR